MSEVIPLGYPFLTVETRVSVSGHERSWQVARMFRENWRGPDDDPPPSARTNRVGKWIAMGTLERMALWRIQDGDWFVDVTLGESVPYEDAELIVFAIRRQNLVDRRPMRSGGAAGWELQRFDASRVTAIQFEWGHKKGTFPREYEITFTDDAFNGHTFHVKIVDKSVELLAILRWIVERRVLPLDILALLSSWSPVRI